MTKIGLRSQEDHPISPTDAPKTEEHVPSVTMSRFLKFSNDLWENNYQNIVVN